MNLNCAEHNAPADSPMRGGLGFSYPGKPDEEDAARACLGTYYDRSSNIVFVAFRSMAKSGEIARLLPAPGQAEALPACQPVETPGKDVDDDTLARAGMAGHAWAQREIWYRFAPMVFALLRRSLGARHEPEDLLQEVFLRVYGRLSTLTNPGALRSFIYSFAVRVVSEEMRRHRIRSRLGAIFLRPVAEPSVPHVDFESRELLSRVQSVLDGMSDRPRAVFVLRRLEGMELSEIATNLDLSLATVKRDLDKANSYVARAIEGDGRLRGRLDHGVARSTTGADDGRS
jgi:RNA polymerase sigma-70 factor (ECF subfamily)